MKSYFCDLHKFKILENETYICGLMFITSLLLTGTKLFCTYHTDFYTNIKTNGFPENIISAISFLNGKVDVPITYFWLLAGIGII